MIPPFVYPAFTACLPLGKQRNLLVFNELHALFTIFTTFPGNTHLHIPPRGRKKPRAGAGKKFFPRNMVNKGKQGKQYYLTH